MGRTQVRVSAIQDPLPPPARPFAVFIDTNDQEWADNAGSVHLIKELLRRGCRHFVCWGEGAEAVHDHIDDVVINDEYEDVTTTFHEEDSREEVARFFSEVVAAGAKDALVLVRDVPGWKRIFSETG